MRKSERMDYYTENELLRMNKNEVVDQYLKLQEENHQIRMSMVAWYEIAQKIKEFEKFKEEFEG